MATVGRPACYHCAASRAPLMIQELFRIGSFSISPFGVMLVFAFLASYLQLRWGMRKHRHRRRGGRERPRLRRGRRRHRRRQDLLRHPQHATGGCSSTARAWSGTAASSWAPWRALDHAPPPAPRLADGRRRAPGPRPRLRRRPHRLLPGGRRLRPAHRPALGRRLPRTACRRPRRASCARLFGVDIPASVPDSELLRVHPTQLYETVAGLAHLGLRPLAVPPRRCGRARVALVVLALLARRALPGRVRARQGRPLLRTVHPGPGDQRRGAADRRSVLAWLRYRRPAAPARASRPA